LSNLTVIPRSLRPERAAVLHLRDSTKLLTDQSNPSIEQAPEPKRKRDRMQRKQLVPGWKPSKGEGEHVAAAAAEGGERRRASRGKGDRRRRGA
jgi:hypothetical protein